MLFLQTVNIDCEMFFDSEKEQYEKRCVRNRFVFETKDVIPTKKYVM